MFGVPSRSTIARSRPAWSEASRPRTAPASSPLTFATAFVTPLPPHSSPPSRSSTASCTPVEAPDGTIARPSAPESSAPRPRPSGCLANPGPAGPARGRSLTRLAPLPDRSTRPARRAEAAVQSLPFAAASVAAVSTRARKRLAAARSSSSGSTFKSPRDVHQREQHVAQLGRDAAIRLALGRRVRLRQLLAELAQLVVEVGERAGEIGVLEADASRPLLHFARVEQRRQRLGDVVEDPLAPLVLALQLLPALADALRRCALRRRRTRADGARRASRGRRAPPSRDRRCRAPAGAARGSTTGRADRRSRRAASRRRPRARRPRPRTPLRPCAGRSCFVVCSRSHGHSRRSRSVSSWSSTSASASDTSLVVVAVVVVELRLVHGSGRGVQPTEYLICEPLQYCFFAFVAQSVAAAAASACQQRLLDRRADLLLRRRRSLLDGADRPDHEPRLVLRRVVDRRVQPCSSARRTRLVENRHGLTLCERRLAAALAARVLRVLLRERAPRLRVAVLQLLVDALRDRLLLANEDVAHVARLRAASTSSVRLVVRVDVLLRNRRCPW